MRRSKVDRETLPKDCAGEKWSGEGGLGRGAQTRFRHFAKGLVPCYQGENLV
jgi:hypothetical protein